VGRGGVPDEVRQKAAQHKVKTSSLVRTYAELEDALANGYPVTVCSNQGFTLQRDAQGSAGRRAMESLYAHMRSQDR
jgi:hypothetical protein